MADFNIPQHDTFPYPQAPLTDLSGAINLTGAVSVKFIAKLSDGTKTITGAAGFVDRSAGIVNYVWATGDTDFPGTYKVEWEITWAIAVGQTPAKIETVPNLAANREQLIIGADLG